MNGRCKGAGMGIEDTWTWSFTPDDEDDPPEGWLSALSALGLLADRKSISDPVSALLNACRSGGVKTWIRVFEVGDRSYQRLLMPPQFWNGLDVAAFKRGAESNDFHAGFSGQKGVVTGRAVGAYFDQEAVLATVGRSLVQVQPSGRKGGGKDYRLTDKPLVQEMKRRLDENPKESVWFAALSVADRAEGQASAESKAKRLRIRFHELYGGGSSHSVQN